MTTDERLAEVIACLKSEDKDLLFKELSKVCDELGFELSYRDPGPVYCDFDTGWCKTHEAWIDDHQWRMSPEDLAIEEAKLTHPATPLGWFKLAGVVPLDAEMGTTQIKDTYRRLAAVRRVPSE